ncbi:MAG: chordopoxvirus fusion protein [bacterium]
MPTLTSEDLEQIIRIVREIVRQEIDTRLPIHEEILNLKSAVNELAEAQRRTEERLERLEMIVESLAEAQRRTEERVNELAEAQRRTEERVNELAEAQRRTEESLRELTLVVKDLQKQVGGIAHSVGFQLEDRAYISLPRLLKRDFGIELKERLIRRYIKNKKGEKMEINILGRGERDGKEIYIVGEAKANLSARHIEDFIDRLKDIKDILGIEIFPIMITYMTEPEVEEFANNKGIKVYYSYDFEPVY